MLYRRYIGDVSMVYWCLYHGPTIVGPCLYEAWIRLIIGLCFCRSVAPLSMPPRKKTPAELGKYKKKGRRQEKVERIRYRRRDPNFRASERARNAKSRQRAHQNSVRVEDQDCNTLELAVSGSERAAADFQRNIREIPAMVDNAGCEGILPQLKCEMRIKAEPEEYNEEGACDMEKETKYLGDMYSFLDAAPPNNSQTSAKEWTENVIVKVEPSDVNPDLDTPVTTTEVVGESDQVKPQKQKRVAKKSVRAQPFQCNFEGCRLGFAQESQLEIHMDTHSTAERFTCYLEGCGRRFKGTPNYYRHLKTHTGDGSFKCAVEDCGQSFSCQYSLQKHMSKHTKIKHRCGFPRCSKVFKFKVSLWRHMFAHTVKRSQNGGGSVSKAKEGEGSGEADPKNGGESKGNIEVAGVSKKQPAKCAIAKPFQCDVGGSRLDFTPKPKLDIDSQTDVKPILKQFTCYFEGCGLMFTNTLTYNRHLKTHISKNKAFNCTVDGCGQSFRYKNGLQKHMVGHVDRHQCGFEGCGQVFQQKVLLWKHMFAHTVGEAKGANKQCEDGLKNEEKVEENIT